MMARPARVRMRSRKPCVLARWRLFGWKVRFTSGLHRRPVQAVNYRRPPRRANMRAVRWSPRRNDPRYVARQHRVKPDQRGRCQRPSAGGMELRISGATRREPRNNLWTSVEPISWTCYRPGFDSVVSAARLPGRTQYFRRSAVVRRAVSTVGRGLHTLWMTVWTCSATVARS